MDCSLNIVQLIESNPIVKLSNTYNSRLLTKIQDKFTESQQQLFISSFFCYLNYHPTNDFIIDLDNIWQWLGFSQKAMAKRSLEKYFLVEKDYKLSLLRSQEQSLCRSAERNKDTKGGQNREQILLNIETFKLFCIKAGTKKANEIHEYFVKLERLLHEVMEEESTELKLQLEQAKNTISQNDENNQKKLEKMKELEREKILLRDYAHIGSIIYIIRVKTFENGHYIIKIGESRRGVENRYNEHKHNYEECVLLNCFSVAKSKDFECFIHNHEQIYKSKVKDLLGHETENELFYIGKQLSYSTVVRIIESNIQTFNEMKQIDFIYMLEDLIKSPNDNNIMETLRNIQQTQNIILERLNQIEQNNNIQTIKTRTNFNETLVTVGPRLQMINPETMTLIKTYESIAECIKESKHKYCRSSIVKAIEENHILYGFRWAYRSRDEDPNILGEIKPTVKTRPQNLGYIAKLNSEKTQILNVFLDRKTAAIQNGFNGGSLDTPVKQNSIARGHYYMLYDKCDENVRTQFENQHGEPILYKDGIGKFNLNQELVQEFICKYKCIKMLQISDKTLTKALQKNIPYGGFFFRNIGSKLFI